MIEVLGRLQLQLDRQPCLPCLRLLVRIETEIQLVKTPAKLDIAQYPFGLPHRAERWLSLDPACAAPLEKLGYEPIDRGGQQGQWHGHEVCLWHAAWNGDWLIQRIRWSQPRNRPDIPKMRSEEPIELLFIIGIEVVSIPPEPIAAFGGIEFVPGGLRAIRGERGNDFGEMGSVVTHEVRSR